MLICFGFHPMQNIRFHLIPSDFVENFMAHVGIELQGDVSNAGGG